MNWTREEFDASVKAYQKMRNLEGSRQKFVKKHIYEELSSRFGRTTKSFEYRMQNISYVYLLMDRRWVTGLKPAKHIGPNVITLIKELILENESGSGELQVSFDDQVNQIRKNKPVAKPVGEKEPKKKETKSTTYERDPSVVAWLLENSNGVCECCKKPAPFIKSDGDFYLEVHHLRRLADGGSDFVTNAIAVCPNCHRELHYGENKSDILASIYKKISRLIEE